MHCSFRNYEALFIYTMVCFTSKWGDLSVLRLDMQITLKFSLPYSAFWTKSNKGNRQGQLSFVELNAGKYKSVITKCCKAELSFSKWPCSDHSAHSNMYQWRWRCTALPLLTPTHTHLSPSHSKLLPPVPHAGVYITHSLAIILTHISAPSVHLLSCRGHPLQMHLFTPYPNHLDSCPTDLPTFFLVSASSCSLQPLLKSLTCVIPCPVPRPVIVDPHWCSVCMSNTDRGLLHRIGWAIIITTYYALPSHQVTFWLYEKKMHVTIFYDWIFWATLFWFP